MRISLLVLLVTGSLSFGVSQRELKPLREMKRDRIAVQRVEVKQMPPQNLDRVEARVMARRSYFTWLWRLCSGQRR